MPLTVIVLDANNKAVQGVLVAFAIASIPIGATGQHVGSSSVTTGSDGIASVILTLGNAGGQYIVTATVESITPVVFTATGIALSSYADLKKYLGIKDADTTNDALYSSWLGEVSIEIERRLRQAVMPRIGMSEILNGNRMSVLYMEQARIVELTKDNMGSILSSVQVRDTSEEDWYNLLDYDESIYIETSRNYPWSVELLDYNYFPWGLRNIKISFTGGMNPIPGDIHEMSQQMVQLMIDNSKHGGAPRLGMKTRSRGIAGVPLGDSYIDIDSEQWQKVINRWKRLI